MTGGLAREDEQWWPGGDTSGGRGALLAAPDVPQPPQSVVSSRGVNISWGTTWTCGQLCYEIEYIYRVDNGLRSPGLNACTMRILETVLLFLWLSMTLSMSESEESLEDGPVGSNDTRVTNDTKHEVNLQQLKYSYKT